MEFVFRLSVLFILLSSSPVLATGSFTLTQLGDAFPSAGLEASIDFWVQIFSRHGDQEVLIHDQDDLRLVYEKVIFPRGVRDDRAEYRRQRDELREKEKQLQGRLDDIRRHGVGSKRLTEAHHGILELLGEHGYQPDAPTLNRLRNNIRSQRGIRERFLEGLIRSGRYLDRIEGILKEEGVPAELAYMPHVESSFDYRAYSKRGAAGIWQFMRGTGRLYMTVTSRIDERLDPAKATRAAARLLRTNYQALESWPLAITAFNHGRNGMLRAKRQFGTDINVVVQRYQSRTFGFASKNFYAEFLAALVVGKNYHEYFGPVELDPPFRYDTVALEAAYHVDHLLRGAEMEEEVFRAYNPHLREPVWKNSRVVPAGTTVRVPEGLAQQVAGHLQTAPRAAGVLETTGDGRMAYRVQEGDTLGAIAAVLGTSARSLQHINGIRDPNRIYPGQMLVSSEAPPDTTYYRVRRGDTLARIASRFGTSVGRLQEANQIDDPHRIYLGQRILIPR